MSTDNNTADTQAAQISARNSQNLAGIIKEAALRGDFAEADALREELIAGDPMNLNLIVSTGEIIEEQKFKLLDKDHLAVWQELYQECNTEETNSLFYSLEPATIEPSKLLQVQGKVSNRLFFIDSGKVVLFYRKEDKNKVVLELGRGDIVGEENFFEISLCPLSAATQSEVNLYSLTRSAAEKWHEMQPGLYEKIRDFCQKTGKSKSGVAQKNLDRRSSSRYPVSGVVTATILDQEGKPSENYFKGPMTDISRTGLCFDIKCSNYETARAILARTIEISAVFSGGEDACWVQQGIITKVSFHLHNDYTVHVRLHDIIEEELFKSFPCDWSVDDQSEEE